MGSVEANRIGAQEIIRLLTFRLFPKVFPIRYFLLYRPFEYAPPNKIEIINQLFIYSDREVSELEILFG
jgi:hypothetical protein